MSDSMNLLKYMSQKKIVFDYESNLTEVRNANEEVEKSSSEMHVIRLFHTINQRLYSGTEIWH